MSCDVVDGVVLAVVVEVVVVLGVAVELVSVVDDVVPATVNTPRLDLSTTAKQNRARHLQAEQRVTMPIRRFPGAPSDALAIDRYASQMDASTMCESDPTTLRAATDRVASLVERHRAKTRSHEVGDRTVAVRWSQEWTSAMRGTSS